MRKFKFIYVETTNICNLSCSFCPKTKRPFGFMSVKSFRFIAKECKKHTDYINLHVMGEPTIHPKLAEILEAANKEELHVKITTNGTTIHEVHHLLLNSPSVYKIVFSLHSLEGNGHNAQTKYIEHICNFIKDASRQGIICCLRLWNLGVDGQNNLNDFMIQFIEDFFDIKVVLNPCYLQKDLLLAENVFLQFGDKFDWPEEATSQEGALDSSGFCYGLRTHMAILWDGTVIPCCLDNDGTIMLGNILEQSIEEIVQSSRAKAIYDGFSARTRIESLCKGCRFINKFKK